MSEPCIDCGSPAEEGSSWCRECNAPIYGSPPLVNRVTWATRTFRESSENA